MIRKTGEYIVFDCSAESPKGCRSIVTTMNRWSHKYGNIVEMKTTIEIPDPLFRQAKARAAELGQSLKQLVTEALQEKLAGGSQPGQPNWMRGFGRLRSLHEETERIQARIEAAFEEIEPEDRA